MRLAAAILLLAAVLPAAVAAQATPAVTRGGKLESAAGVGVWLAAESDAGTTYAALHACTRCREGDPLMGPLAKTPAVFVMSAAEAWLTVHAACRLRGAGHGRAALALELAAMGLHGWAATHNAELMGSGR
ncbi:MAG TPA: hypothetical protein VGR47_05920 [Terracidiphilus sp.]|nr:hypothetical protein [Terracidiphilus sp.]